MATIFSKIIAGEIPSYQIYEDELYYAFLDINPLAEGHTLVIPKVETDYLFDLEDDLLSGMMVVAKKSGTCNRSDYGLQTGRGGCTWPGGSPCPYTSCTS